MELTASPMRGCPEERTSRVLSTDKLDPNTSGNSMIAVDNAVSLRLLEELCADLRARAQIQAKPPRRALLRTPRNFGIANQVMRVLAILTGACLMLKEI